MDFLPRELIAQLEELYQHSFHKTILCLLGTSHNTFLTRPHHITLFLTLHLKSEALYVTSNKYVAAALSWTELLSHEHRPPGPPLPATALAWCPSMFRPVSPEPRVPRPSLWPEQNIAQPLPVLASPTWSTSDNQNDFFMDEKKVL